MDKGYRSRPEFFFAGTPRISAVFFLLILRSPFLE
jgi:hypothetical protein